MSLGELPDELMLAIFALLEVPEIVRTALISARCRKLLPEAFLDTKSVEALKYVICFYIEAVTPSTANIQTASLLAERLRLLQMANSKRLQMPDSPHSLRPNPSLGFPLEATVEGTVRRRVLHLARPQFSMALDESAEAVALEIKERQIPYLWDPAASKVLQAPRRDVQMSREEVEIAIIRDYSHSGTYLQVPLGDQTVAPTMDEALNSEETGAQEALALASYRRCHYSRGGERRGTEPNEL